MVAMRRCSGVTNAGGRCDATPLRDQDFCFWHSPDHVQEATAARRLGGLRRRREHAVAGAYELEGLGSVAELQRLLEIAAFDALGLENSIARVRALAALVQVGVRLLELGELEARIETLEATLQPRIAAARRR